jgi:cyclopropane fatty-acyl-phospholipid synthase-like methyltransferase
MAELSDREAFGNFYAGKAPWDIGKPQPVFAGLADRIKGMVLDSGCGTGDIALFLAERGCQVTGIDFLEEPIKRAKNKAAERKLSASFLVKDALTLKDWDQRFDAVVDCGLFHVFNDDDRRKYVAGLATVLKPAGMLYLMCFSDEEPGVYGPRRVARAELEQAFGHGWKIESISKVRFEIRPDFHDTTFSPGGPKSWFLIAHREG